MPEVNSITNPTDFSEALFIKMKLISPALEDFEIYEFQYCLDNLIPEKGWDSVKLESKEKIQETVNNRDFYKNIQVNKKEQGKILLDEQIVHLAQMLFVGLVAGNYEHDWINTHFYFDVRGFYFLHRTDYFTGKVLAHFGEKPFVKLRPKTDKI